MTDSTLVDQIATYHYFVKLIRRANDLGLDFKFDTDALILVELTKSRYFSSVELIDAYLDGYFAGRPAVVTERLTDDNR